MYLKPGGASFWGAASMLAKTMDPGTRGKALLAFELEVDSNLSLDTSSKKEEARIMQLVLNFPRGAGLGPRRSSAKSDSTLRHCSVRSRIAVVSRELLVLFYVFRYCSCQSSFEPHKMVYIDASSFSVATHCP